MPAPAAPFNFNGLVRHYFLRNSPEMGDLMVTLLPKGDRDRVEPRHCAWTCAKAEGVPLPAGASIKVVETPPGPPVMATLLAEIYGPDEETRRRRPRLRRKAFKVGALYRRCRQQLRPAAPDGLRLVPDRAGSISTVCPSADCSIRSARCWAARPSAMSRAGQGRTSAADRNGAAAVAAQLVASLAAPRSQSARAGN
jgi:hypothetical protein